MHIHGVALYISGRNAVVSQKHRCRGGIVDAKAAFPTLQKPKGKILRIPRHGLGIQTVRCQTGNILCNPVGGQDGVGILQGKVFFIQSLTGGVGELGKIRAVSCRVEHGKTHIGGA